MLEEVGFSRDQAETSIRILVEIMEDKLASKQDIKELEHRITVRMGVMLAASIAVLTTIQGVIAFLGSASVLRSTTSVSPITSPKR